MHILYKSVLTQLSSNVPELVWIDEETGQLEFEEENYPVTFPACLIDIQQIDWETRGKQNQEGDAIIVFRIAFDIYEDTHKDSPDMDIALNRLKLLNKIHSFLQGFGGNILPDPNNAGKYLDINFKRLDRRRTITEKRHDGLRVYSVEYKTNFLDTYAQPVFTTKQATPVITGTFEQSI